MGETPGRITQKVPNPVTYLRTVINLDEETRHDKLDKLIVKVFPPFIFASAILVLVLVIYLGNYTFPGVVFGICLGFTIGFTVLGVACVVLSDKGVIIWKYFIPALIFIPLLVAYILYLAGPDIGFNAFIMKYFDIFDDLFGRNMDFLSLLIGVYSITLMAFFVAHGVVSVIVGYFRSYLYRVLRALEAPPEKRKNHIPEWLFQIPSIIDVKSVELEPDIDDERFNVELFLNTFFSLFILGIVICSYIFINPLFLRLLPFSEMLLIGMLLSLFISPLVIPWSIVKSIGAKVTSDAPRDFYLWKGMRGRLYQGFFTITFFMMLLTMSVYFGMDISRVAATYLGYIAFMGMMSLVTSFVYVNTYYKGFKNGIIKSYLRSKEQ